MVIGHTVAGTTNAFVLWFKKNPKLQTDEALEQYVIGHPDEVHAAIVFDLFIANNDRAFGPERRNLALDNRGRLLLYDHGNACFYRQRKVEGIQAGIPRLNAVESNLTAMFDMDFKTNHYRELLKDWNLVKKWCDRIEALPEFLIEAAVNRIPEEIEKPDQLEREHLVEFLVRRRNYLYTHIEKHRGSFPGLS